MEPATRYGALLMIDETHTISTDWVARPEHGTCSPTSSSSASPSAAASRGAYGITEAVAEAITTHTDAGHADIVDVGGVGGTLAGNALSTAAMRATLSEVLTQDAFARMIDLATAFTQGVQEVFDEFDVPWSVTRAGARAEYRFISPAPRTGEASAGPPTTTRSMPICTWRCATAASS